MMSMKIETIMSSKQNIALDIYTDKWQELDLTQEEAQQLVDHLCALLKDLDYASMCTCGEKSVTDCPGEWENGCDLGANERFVVVSTGRVDYE